MYNILYYSNNKGCQIINESEIQQICEKQINDSIEAIDFIKNCSHPITSIESIKEYENTNQLKIHFCNCKEKCEKCKCEIL